MEFIYKNIKFNFNKENGEISIIGGSIYDNIYVEKEGNYYIIIELSEDYVYSNFGWENEEKGILKKYKKWEDIVVDFVDNYYKI